MKKHVLTLLMSLLFWAVLLAQTNERRSGEILVQLSADAGIQTVVHQLGKAAGVPVSLKTAVAPEWGIYLLGFDETVANINKVLLAARRLPGVAAVQGNVRVFERAIPNDPNWSQQDDMDLIGMPAAWDVSTGGVTPAGDTIVIAVLEKGALLSHPDLEPNVWYNYGEVPDNGLDDDGNGYADDYRGWNPRTGDDSPGVIGTHGTSVNGIIGARGNNLTGVTGVNWSVKLMNLANVEYESEIIAAYNYVAKMRKLYNTSNKTKGAFVVATNASFGINYAWAVDHPLWCAVYDSLGQAGIISVGATTNTDLNVDTQGDMPSTCPSEFLITVNNVDRFDKKVTATGYGSTHIDLGAPGQGSYTTRSEGVSPKYGPFDGTSAATPHVTGAVGLIYALDCVNFTADALTQPATCARRVRDVILQNVSPNTTLQGVTATGGRLDVAAATQAVQDLCGGAPTGPLEILWVRPNPVENVLRVRYQTPVYNPYRFRIYDILGRQLYEETVTPDPFSQNIWEFDASQLPKGVYVVSFGRNDVVRSEKFVKK